MSVPIKINNATSYEYLPACPRVDEFIDEKEIINVEWKRGYDVWPGNRYDKGGWFAHITTKGK